MAESLKDKTVKGVAWSALERFSVQGVMFILTIIMARLLTPEDYGLIGMLAIFIAVAQSLIDSGFTQALVRKQDRTETDECTVFYFNIVVSALMYLVLFASAPFVAEFYGIPDLCLIMRVMTISMLFDSFAVVQRALYTINLDFKSQAKASFSSVLISGIAGIWSAYHGFGVWALVIQQIIRAVINTIVLWYYSSWRPKLLYSWTSFRELFSFGSKLLASGLLNTIYTNIYPIVIGKVFSAQSLGYYSRAGQFADFPSSNITGIMQRVTYPVLCSIQNDMERLRSSYRKFLKLSAYIVFPMMTGLAAVAYPFINVVLGEKWMFSATLLQIICFSGMWYPIHAINLNLLQVTGRSDLFLKLEIIKKIYGITILCITVPLGLIAMCYGGIVGCFIGLIINTYYSGKLIGVGFIMQMKDLFPTFALSMAMFVVVLLVVNILGTGILSLIVGSLAGALIYIVASLIFKFKEFDELWKIIRRK